MFAASVASSSESSSESMWAMGLGVGRQAESAEQIDDKGVGW